MTVRAPLKPFTAHFISAGVKMPWRPYISTPSAGIRKTSIMGAAMDRAPHPYTAAELSAITGVDLTTAKAWLRKNYTAEKISGRRIPRAPIMGDRGRPVMEYWRGRQSIADTWTEVESMSEETQQKLSEGRRPVSWRDGTRTAWSIDEAGTITAMKGSSVVRFGKMESMSNDSEGMRIKIRNGPTMIFKKA